MKMTFTAQERGDFFDELYGYKYGWKPDKHPTFDPGSGFVVAHDVLEHRPDDEEKIATELMAIGASLYVEQDLEYNNWDRIGSDSAVFSKGKTIPPAPVITAEFPTKILKRLASGLRLFLDRVYDSASEGYTSLNADYVMGWWKAGYLASQRRYNGIETRRLGDAHKFIVKTGDEMRRKAKKGERLLVTVTKKVKGGENYLKIEMVHLSNTGEVKSRAVHDPVDKSETGHIVLD